MEQIKITIYGSPQGKKAPRSRHVKTKDGREFNLVYSPKVTKNYENFIKSEYHRLYPGVFLDGAIYMAVIAYFPIPKSTSKKKMELMISGKIRPVVKPDYDNICKTAADGLKGLAFKDDSYIVDQLFRKYYSDRPRLEILLFPIRQGDIEIEMTPQFLIKSLKMF
jgi:Holliday junction resolvase RusA-like endonuclease